jgi:hypothetical protein
MERLKVEGTGTGASGGDRKVEGGGIEREKVEETEREAGRDENGLKLWVYKGRRRKGRERSEWRGWKSRRWWDRKGEGRRDKKAGWKG